MSGNSFNTENAGIKSKEELIAELKESMDKGEEIFEPPKFVHVDCNCPQSLRLIEENKLLKEQFKNCTKRFTTSVTENLDIEAKVKKLKAFLLGIRSGADLIAKGALAPYEPWAESVVNSIDELTKEHDAYCEYREGLSCNCHLKGK